MRPSRYALAVLAFIATPAAAGDAFLDLRLRVEGLEQRRLLDAIEEQGRIGLPMSPQEKAERKAREVAVTRSFCEHSPSACAFLQAPQQEPSVDSCLTFTNVCGSAQTRAEIGRKAEELGRRIAAQCPDPKAPCDLLRD